MRAYTPGGPRSWLEAMPRGYRNNPDVLLFLVPDDAMWKEIEKDGCRIGYIELASTKELIGLQVLTPSIHERIEHTRRINAAGHKAATATYVGPMENIPQSVLLHAGMSPVVILRGDLSHKFFNLKAWSYFIQGEAPCN